jgi:hypothetical protein
LERSRVIVGGLAAVGDELVADVPLGVEGVPTRKGKACVEAGLSTIKDVEDETPGDSASRDIISCGECLRSCSTPTRLPRRPWSSTTWC